MIVLQLIRECKNAPTENNRGTKKCFFALYELEVKLH